LPGGISSDINRLSHSAAMLNPLSAWSWTYISNVVV
jgi:hypothetical protein